MTDDKVYEAAKKGIYIVVIATVLAWAGPALMGIDIDTAGDMSAIDSCDGDSVDAAACINSVRDSVKSGVGVVVEIFRYVLIAATIGTVAILKMRPVPYSTV